MCMERLQRLLLQNQSNLDRLRVRDTYCMTMRRTTVFDFHKQYGPYADYWDQWLSEVSEISADIKSDIAATEQFVDELREFCVATIPERRRTTVSKKRIAEMQSVAEEAASCQQDMIHIADQRIAMHREFTEKLLLVEAIDSLNDE